MVQFDTIFVAELLGAILAFAGGFSLHYVISGLKHRNEMSYAATAITNELDGIQSAIYSFVHDNSPQRKTYYVLVVSSIESIIYSGLFKDFKLETQKALSDIQARAKLVNELNAESLAYLRISEQMGRDSTETKKA